MFGGQRTTRGRDAPDGEARQPLLSSSRERLPEDSVVFAVDSDSDHESEELHDPPNDSARSVRFQEDVQIIAPPLRSAAHSREVGQYTSRSLPRCFSQTAQSSSWTRTS
jgi:sodium-coupled neutral amino acid transporter 11